MPLNSEGSHAAAELMDNLSNSSLNGSLKYVDNEILNDERQIHEEQISNSLGYYSERYIGGSTDPSIGDSGSAGSSSDLNSANHLNQKRLIYQMHNQDQPYDVPKKLRQENHIQKQSHNHNHNHHHNQPIHIIQQP